MADRRGNYNQAPPYMKGGGTCVIGTPVAAANQPANSWITVDRTVGRNEPNPYVIGFQAPPYGGVSSSNGAGAGAGNPYVHVSSASGSATKNSMETVLKLLGRCGKRLEESTRKATGVTTNVWHHLKTGPSMTEAAMSKLAQGTKVLAEGGNDKIFHQTFGVLPGEQLKKSYACYLSTSSGPVIGTLYLSTARLAFCSDNPLSHNNVSNAQQEIIYYQVVVPLDQVRAVNPSASAMNAADRYIQVVTVDNHEFWFMGFVNYDKALKNLSESLLHSSYPYRPYTNS